VLKELQFSNEDVLGMRLRKKRNVEGRTEKLGAWRKKMQAYCVSGRTCCKFSPMLTCVIFLGITGRFY
jgi:hypothetical protein